MGKRKIQGVGDVVAAVTNVFGVQPCKACEERKAKWNNLFPVRLKPRELTEAELNDWQEFQRIRTLRISDKQRKWLCRIYSDVFQVPYYEPCVNCDASPYLRMIERMDKITETYLTIKE